MKYLVYCRTTLESALYESVRLLQASENVHNSLNHTVYFYHILHTYACQHSLYKPLACEPTHFDRYGFAEQLFSLLWSVSENPHNS